MAIGPTVLQTDGAGELYTEERCFVSEWLNMPEHPDLSIARARVTPGTTTRWHALDGVWERYVVLEGRGHVEVDELAAEVAPGDVVVIPPGSRQRIRNVGDGDLLFLAVCTPRFTPAVYRDLE